MRLLVVHQNFPGQFRHLLPAWARQPGWDVRGIGRDTAPGLAGFGQLIRYRLARQASARQHPYLRPMESATLHGQAVARVMLGLRRAGWKPDLILAHPGWGETLYAKDVFPDARLVHYCEWYYNAEGADIGFDPEFPIGFDDRARVRTWNALHALNLAHCDLGITPTRWQWQQHPAALRSKIVVRHEGIPTDGLAPDPTASLTLPSGHRLQAGKPIVSYVARNLEPYRGFHVFMRALQQVQRRHPTAQAVIVGGDDTSYGRRPTGARCWREKMLAEVSLDLQRVHFVPRLSHADFRRLLQVTAVHAYLTYPFVLSWSLLEALACGTRLVVSDTAPVREFIGDADSEQWRVVPFFNVEGWVESIVDALNEGAPRTCPTFATAPHVEPSSYLSFCAQDRGEEYADSLHPGAAYSPYSVRFDASQQNLSHLFA
jgi:glycosyltransferase involved in cell wall biosynthesis